MDKTSDIREGSMKMKCCVSEAIDENGSSTDKVANDTNSSDHAQGQTKPDSSQGKTAERPPAANENVSPLKTKETATGAKVKRKVRSTRRKLNAMINNTSLHFSDTDSEGELTTINTQLHTLNCTEGGEQKPVISITLDSEEVDGSCLLSPEDRGPSQCMYNSFVENLTDIDEIYPSEPENEAKESQYSLKVAEGHCQGETDLEDFEGDDEVHSTIYVEPRSDIFCDYSAETITTKEGDGPFSVEVRNKMYRDDAPRNDVCGGRPDIVVMSQTDEEDMDMSDEEEVEEACCSQRELFEDMDVLAASQVVMKNINKMEGMLLAVKDVSDDAISDCHTDVEDVDQVE